MVCACSVFYASMWLVVVCCFDIILQRFLSEKIQQQITYHTDIHSLSPTKDVGIHRVNKSPGVTDHFRLI